MKTFRIPSNVVLKNETRYISLRTILGSGYEAKCSGDFAYFNKTWLPNWDRLYERFRQFQLNNPDCNEWVCFDHEIKLEFAKHPGQIGTSSYNFPNEYSNREYPTHYKLHVNDRTCKTQSPQTPVKVLDRVRPRKLLMRS